MAETWNWLVTIQFVTKEPSAWVITFVFRVVSWHKHDKWHTCQDLSFVNIFNIYLLKRQEKRTVFYKLSRQTSKFNLSWGFHIKLILIKSKQQFPSLSLLNPHQFYHSYNVDYWMPIKIVKISNKRWKSIWCYLVKQLNDTF